MWLAGTILARGLWPACLHAYMRIHAYRPQLPQCNMLACAHWGWCTAPCWQALTPRYWHVSVRSLGRCARQHTYMRIQACWQGPFLECRSPLRGYQGVGAGGPLNPAIALLYRQILPPAKIFCKKVATRYRDRSETCTTLVRSLHRLHRSHRSKPTYLFSFFLHE